MSIPQFERGDTRQFTWQSCVVPDAAPLFSIANDQGTGIFSATAGQSSTLTFYTFFTMPLSVGLYRYQWRAEKTIGSSVYPFIDRGLFKVEETKVG